MAFEHVAEISPKYWGEYMWSVVNVLQNSAKIWHLTNRDIFQLNVSWTNGYLG